MSVSFDDIVSLQQKIKDMMPAAAQGKGLVCFDYNDAQKIAACLEEICEWRRHDEDERAHSPHRIIVEGFSTESINDAFSDALRKTACYHSQAHDVSITVLGIKELKAGGYRAMLEVHITPMSFSDIEVPDNEYEERKKNKDREYLKRKLDHDEYLKHLVHDHFLDESGITPDVPDYIMIRVDDASLLNMMIEKEFFKAGHELNKNDYKNGYDIRVNFVPPEPKPE